MKVSTAQALKDAGYPQKKTHRRDCKQGLWRKGASGEWGRTDTLYIPDVKDLVDELTKSGAMVSVGYVHDMYAVYCAAYCAAKGCDNIINIFNTDLAEALSGLWLKIQNTADTPF